MNTIRFCIEWIQTFWPHLPLIPPGSMRSWRTWQKVTRANCTSSRWFMMCGGITRRYKHTEQLQIEEVQTWNTSVIQWWRQCWCFFGVFLCKNVHFECGVWRNVSLLHDRWSQCWWTKWFGRRLLTVPLLLTGSSLKIWLMSSPGEMWEINSTSVLFLIRGYKKLCNVFVYILWIVCFLSGSLLKILSYPYLDFSSGRFCTRPSGRWTNMSRRSSRSWRRPRINWKNSSTRG